ncbi:MAG: tetratricopeptide repeat protein [Verrucomicrobia bacterium]|nr:tetratricopeptide repeat protein [Verrucomicrobiota bacterium]
MWWRQDWLFALLLLIVTTLAYLPALNGTPIWDDDAHITQPELRSWDGLVKIWTQPGSTQQYYPFVHTFFWIEHQLWGDAPPGYHVVNIALHCVSALLLLRILRQLEIPGAWLAAAIFALHPVQVESVAWISELKNALSGVFYFSSALIYLEFDRTRKFAPYLISLILFVLGLLSKTVIATLPGALLVIFWWKRGKLSFKRDALPILPFFILGAAAASFTAWIERSLIGAEGSAYDFTFIERVLIAGRVIWFYLGKLIWPLDLIFIYPRWQISQAIWWQYLFPATIAIALAILVWLRRWRRGPLAGMLFFIGTLLPVLGFLNVYPFRYSLVADHFQYLACLGLIVPAAAGISLALTHAESWQRWTGYTLYLCLLVTLTMLSYAQSQIYKNVETVWQTTISKNPTAWMAHNNLGAVLLKKKQLEDAIDHFNKAIEIKPDEASAFTNLGNALLQKGELGEAIFQYQKAVELKPAAAGLHYNLANALLARGEVDDAIAEYESTLAINPNYADAHNNLGAVLLQQGKLDQAIDHYQKALEINPKDVRAEGNLAWALATTPQSTIRKAIAVKLAQHANETSGGANPLVLRILAAAYAQNEQFSEAIETAERALQLATDRNSVLAESLQAELDLYRNGQPCRYGSQE